MSRRDSSEELKSARFLREAPAALADVVLHGVASDPQLWWRSVACPSRAGADGRSPPRRQTSPSRASGALCTPAEAASSWSASTSPPGGRGGQFSCRQGASIACRLTPLSSGYWYVLAETELPGGNLYWNVDQLSFGGCP